MLLSHHPPSQYCRTYKIAGIRFCARCLGIPIGVVLHLILSIDLHWLIWVLLPIPTFLNFLFQELGKMKSINYVKSSLTILLGIYLMENLLQFLKGNYTIGFIMIGYLVTIEFIIAKILDNNGKLDPLITGYEDGVYKNNHTQHGV